MSLLPTEFSDLEPFASLWAVDGSKARAALRGSSTAEQRDAFFTATVGRLSEALAYLDARPLQSLDQQAKNLMNLLLSYAHVAMAVEVQASDEPKHARWRPRMILTRTPAGV